MPSPVAIWGRGGNSRLGALLGAAWGGDFTAVGGIFVFGRTTGAAWGCLVVFSADVRLSMAAGGGPLGYKEGRATLPAGL